MPAARENRLEPFPIEEQVIDGETVFIVKLGSANDCTCFSEEEAHAIAIVRPLIEKFEDWDRYSEQNLYGLATVEKTIEATKRHPTRMGFRLVEALARRMRGQEEDVLGEFIP